VDLCAGTGSCALAAFRSGINSTSYDVGKSQLQCAVSKIDTAHGSALSAAGVQHLVARDALVLPSSQPNADSQLPQCLLANGSGDAEQVQFLFKRPLPLTEKVPHSLTVSFL
jgi:hypothetical protein